MELDLNFPICFHGLRMDSFTWFYPMFSYQEVFSFFTFEMSAERRKIPNVTCVLFVISL